MQAPRAATETRSDRISVLVENQRMSVRMDRYPVDPHLIDAHVWEGRIEIEGRPAGRRHA